MEGAILGVVAVLIAVAFGFGFRMAGKAGFRVEGEKGE